MTGNRCIVTVKTLPEAAVRLVVFPHTGGASHNYRTWADEFSGEIEFNLVEYTGHGTRIGEPLVAGHQSLAAEIAEAIVQDRARTVILGHRPGSLIAFKTAWALSSMRSPPAHLFVSAAQVPSEHASSAPDLDRRRHRITRRRNQVGEVTNAGFDAHPPTGDHSYNSESVS